MPEPRHLVLTYHAVSTSWPSRVAIPESVLREQLSFFKHRGFVGMTFSDSERRRQDGTLPAKSVVVTFDDGFASILRAKPILDELGWPATAFAVSSFPDSGRRLAWHGLEEPEGSVHADETRPLSWNELAGLREHGWEIGSHTVDHRYLPGLDPEIAEHELRTSRETIVSRLGACETIAYPYGGITTEMVELVRGAGYVAGCTGTFVHEFDDTYRRPRVELFPGDRGRRLALKVSRAGLGFRRSVAARAVRKARRKRSWIPVNH